MQTLALETDFSLPVYEGFTHPEGSPFFETGATVADGRYEITGRINTQATTELYKAIDQTDEEFVALKVFHEPDLSVQQRVDKEIASHILLSGQAGIVALRDHGFLDKADGKRRFIAMPFAAHGTLLDNMHEADTPEQRVELTIEMAAKIAQAVKLVRAAGIVHRDIKPANILRSSGNEWLLTDFGIADVSADAGGSSLLAKSLGITIASRMIEENIMGTPGYIPPETIQGDTTPRPEFDVFSLGVTLYRAATAKMPFPNKTPATYQHAVVHESPVPARVVCQAIPGSLNRLIDSCLEYYPKNRPDIEEVESALAEM